MKNPKRDAMRRMIFLLITTLFVFNFSAYAGTENTNAINGVSKTSGTDGNLVNDPKDDKDASSSSSSENLASCKVVNDLKDDKDAPPNAAFRIVCKEGLSGYVLKAANGVSGTNDIDRKALLTFASLLIAILTLFFNSTRQLAIEKNNIYQKLELASIDFFRWEAENRTELLQVIDMGVRGSPEECMLLESYCVQALNLFELMVHNTRNKTFPEEAFRSWLPWIYKFANQKGFRLLWLELSSYYVLECRNMINLATYSQKNECEFINEICEKYKLKIKNKCLHHELSGGGTVQLRGQCPGCHYSTATTKTSRSA
jgi:hypothetical protein